MLNKRIELNPKAKNRILGKTYRFRNIKVLDGRLPTWVDITAPTPAAAIKHLGWNAEDIDIAKVWKSSGKIGESGHVTPGGWSKLILLGTQPKETRREREDRERHDAFQKQCRENEDKGLTMFGYTKKFEGQSVTFYLNNIEIACKVDYDMSCPHLEFRGKPNVLTETGYRSHFMQGDLTGYASLKALVEEQVEYIIRNRYCQNSKAKYTLTWEPSLEYLKHSPEQLSLFGKGGTMLNKQFVRKLNLADCRGYKGSIGAELKLTHRRIKRLLSTQDKNPGWAAYDKYADDIVGIDIRIEEQYAVAEDLEADLGLLFEREDIINQLAAYTGKSPSADRSAIQLGFFDTAKRRARLGVPCSPYSSLNLLDNRDNSDYNEYREAMPC